MINIVIPSAGKGMRFKEAGYQIPKPNLPLNNSTMLNEVIKNVTPTKYSHRIIIITSEMVGETEGAACTVLTQSKSIDNSDPLIIANCDQLVDWYTGSIDEFINKMEELNSDAGIVTFISTNKKWSYVSLMELKDETVMYTIEKPSILPSAIATSGIYYWKRGSDFVRSAKRMIEDNFRVNGEFYVCPSFNWIPRDKLISAYSLKGDRMHGLGTPEDYEDYIQKQSLGTRI